jgi:hypothetical protein
MALAPSPELVGLPLHRDLVAALTAALFMAMIGVGARVSARLSGAPLAPIVLSRWLDDMTWPSLMVFAGISIIFLLGHGASHTDPLVVWGSREWGKFTFACTVTAGYAAGGTSARRVPPAPAASAVLVPLLVALNYALLASAVYVSAGSKPAARSSGAAVSEVRNCRKRSARLA